MSKMQKNTRLINGVVGIGTLLAVVLADQITKRIVVDRMELGSSVDVIKGVLRFTYITNNGSAFGMFSDRRWVFMVLSAVGIGAMIAYVAFYLDKLSRPTLISIALIAGGGVGNMIDRVFNGSTFGDGTVVDFIDFCAFPKIWTYIFNVADACVCVGCALFVLILILDEVKQSKSRKAAAPAPAAPTASVQTSATPTSSTSADPAQTSAPETTEADEKHEEEK